MMAIDSERKRYSMMGFSDTTALWVDVPPDNDIEVADRQALLGLYASGSSSMPEEPDVSAVFGFDDGSNYEWADNQFGFVDRVE